VRTPRDITGLKESTITCFKNCTDYKRETSKYQISPKEPHREDQPQVP